MEPLELAEQLQSFLLHHVPAEALDNLPPDDVIGFYNHGLEIGEPLFSDLEMRRIVDRCKSAEDFKKEIRLGIEKRKDHPVTILRKKFGKQLPEYIITTYRYYTNELLAKLEGLSADRASQVEPERFTVVVVRTSDEKVVKTVEYLRNSEECIGDKFGETCSQIFQEFEGSNVIHIGPNIASLDTCGCKDCHGFRTDYVSTVEYLCILDEKEEKRKKRRRPKKH